MATTRGTETEIRPVDGGIGVVIVHFGDPTLARDAIASVLDDSSSTDRRVMVVDNAGNFPAAGCSNGVRILPSSDNPGYGAGLNRGVRALQSDGRFCGYLCLNNDVTVLPGYLDAAASAITEDGVGAAGGPTFRDPDRRSVWYAGGAVNFVLGSVFHNRANAAVETTRRVGFIPGAAIAINAAAWDQVRGFDERFFLYNEDLDLCLRLRRRRWSLVFEPKMAAIHRLGGATGSAERSALYLEHITRTRLRPFRPLPYRLYLAVLHSGWVVLRSFGIVARGDRSSATKIRALFKGHVDALKTVLSD
jgi:N-acetylglucosaminyl-diphospho-decaprenol L-rhamnosyltransferase